MLSACSGNDSATNPGNGIGGEPPPGYTYSPPAAIGDGWTVGDAGSQGTLIFDETTRTRLDDKDQWVGNGDLALHARFSSSKSIASILIGIAIDLGNIGGVEVDPGTEFAYNTIASVSLCQAIQNRAPLTCVDFLNTYLLDPLSISRVAWIETPTGLPDLGGGLYLSGRDMLKFGQIYMDKGRWNGQQIVSSEWVTASIKPYTELAWTEPETRDWQVDGYGYQWWVGHFERNGQILSAFAARGWGQQTLMVIPELELIIAINANDYDGRPDAVNQVFGLIDRFILPAPR